MHMKKEAVSGTEKVNQGLEVTLPCETETREHRRGANRRDFNVVHGASADCWGGLTALREA